MDKVDVDEAVAAVVPEFVRRTEKIRIDSRKKKRI
jgi:hypothetical protein